MKNDNIKSWFSSNIWNILVAVITLVVTYTVSTTAINYRVQAIEKVNEDQSKQIDKMEILLQTLPNKEFMDLKLQPMIDDISSIKTDLKEHLKESN
jgi:hypothetical protein